jgi:hypothetical protein
MYLKWIREGNTKMYRTIERAVFMILGTLLIVFYTVSRLNVWLEFVIGSILCYIAYCIADKVQKHMETKNE